MSDPDHVTSHHVTEQARLISHRLYAKAVDGKPELVEEARAFLDEGIADNGGTMGQRLWQSVLKRPWHQVRERMLADDPEGRLLRSNSPFSHLIGIADDQLRRRIWREAKAELYTLGTSSTRSAA